MDRQQHSSQFYKIQGQLNWPINQHQVCSPQQQNLQTMQGAWENPQNLNNTRVSFQQITHPLSMNFDTNIQQNQSNFQTGLLPQQHYFQMQQLYINGCYPAINEGQQILRHQIDPAASNYQQLSYVRGHAQQLINPVFQGKSLSQEFSSAQILQQPTPAQQPSEIHQQALYTRTPQIINQPNVGFSPRQINPQFMRPEVISNMYLPTQPNPLMLGHAVPQNRFSGLTCDPNFSPLNASAPNYNQTERPLIKTRISQSAYQTEVHPTKQNPKNDITTIGNFTVTNINKGAANQTFIPDEGEKQNPSYGHNVNLRPQLASVKQLLSKSVLYRMPANPDQIKIHSLEKGPVRYISSNESDGENSSNSMTENTTHHTNTKPTQKNKALRKQVSQQSETESSSDEDNQSETNVLESTNLYNQQSTSKQVKFQKYPHPSSSGSVKGYKKKTSQVNVITDIDKLQSVGKFKKLKPNDDDYKMISEYAINSHNVPEFNGKVILHNIYKINQARNKSVTKLENKTLLWFKTNTESIYYLGNVDKCVAFYDRLARAFAKNTKTLDESFRQIILLCSVVLGKVHKSPKGFSYWSKEYGIGEFLPGYNCIRGEGRHIPGRNITYGHDLIKVPLGKTINNSSEAELAYREFIVPNAEQITAMYAIDVEVKPTKEKGKKTKNVPKNVVLSSSDSSL